MTAAAPTNRSVFRRGIRVIFGYVRLHPAPFAIAVVGAAVFAVALVAATWVLGWVTDDVIVPAVENGEVGLGTVLGVTGALIGVTAVRAVGVVARRYFGSMTAFRTQATLRRDVTDTYLEVPLEYHLKGSTGELLAHADADVEATTDAMIPLPLTTGVLTLIVFSVVALAAIDPLLMLVGVAVFPTLTLMNHLYTARVEEPAAMVQHRLGEASNVAHESFDGALVVKTLGLERAEVSRMAEASDRLRDARISVGRLRAVFEPTMDAVPSVAMVALLLIGSWRLSQGAVSTGNIVTAMALFGVLAFPMRVVGFFLEELPRSVVSAERIQGVIAARPAVDDRSGSLPTDGEPAVPATRAAATADPAAVTAEDLAYTYTTDDARVLDGVSLSLEPGEVVALVGPTGAGKSTLCQLLVGLITPSEGTVRLDGIALDELDPGVLRSEAAIVFQESFLFAESVAENIAMSLPLDAAERDAAVRIAQADSFIAAMPQGYDTVLGERGVSLSGGQRQRVALARALVRRPRLLILDDATSAVDPRIEARILDGLRTSLGATTLVVAHRLSTIELADRVVYLDAGRVVATGTHAELLDHPAYERLVRAYEEEALG